MNFALPSESPEIPADLKAAAARADEQIVIVMGAGCSREDPTSLELAHELAERIHRILVANSVLNPDVVNDPKDLSEVAQAVIDETGSQRLLVDEFPPSDFQSARPNGGHLTLAALLREGVVGDVLTLNFDLSVSSAVSVVGAGREARIIKGPEEHSRLGARNVIYLHRNIESPPDELILRPEQMIEAWEGQWEEVIARRVLGGPMTVFVGLGSPAAVLTATARRIIDSLATGSVTYVVDPGEPSQSGFFAALEIPEERYLRLGWCDFMHALGERVVQEHAAGLITASQALIREDPARQSEDVGDLCRRLAAAGLLAFGRVRARWFLDAGDYLPHPVDEVGLKLLADLLTGVAMLERLSGREVRVDDEGIVLFGGSGGPAVLVVSGKGVMSWELVEARIAHRARELARKDRTLNAAVAGAVVGSRDAVVVPENIAGGTTDASVAGSGSVEVVGLDDIRRRPELAQRLVA